MSNYNPFERAIARTLNRFPSLKSFAKSTYSRIMFYKNKKSYKNKTYSELTCFSVDNKSSFFGYYDKSPENSKGLVLVYLTQANTSEKPSLKQKVTLAVFNQDDNILVRLPINAHNWQQGARAQWIDQDLFIYNDFDYTTNSYVSRVYSVSNNLEIKKFNLPVQDSYQKDYFISINYQRLMSLRADYGYRNLDNLNNEQLAKIDNDGLWKINFETGESELFISIAEVCKLKSKDDFINATHKLNHVIISKDGSKFIFMHRYRINGQRFDRLLVANAKTAEISVLSDYGMVSHCFWVDNNTILGYMRGPGNIDGYWLLDVISGRFSELPCKDIVKFGDGHPYVHGDWFITDTYPDKARMQHLLWCNWKTGEVKEVGEFFHGFQFNGESRCDLHPRLSADGHSVYFDSVFTGKRQLYKMRLPK